MNEEEDYRYILSWRLNNKTPEEIYQPEVYSLVQAKKEQEELRKIWKGTKREYKIYRLVPVGEEE